MLQMKTKTEIPLTIYGLLARKHDVKDVNYVGEIVRGERKAIRGKAKAILEDWKKLENNIDNWFADFKLDGAIVVGMEDININVFVQRGVASIYKNNELLDEVDLDPESVSLNRFKQFLNGVRLNYN